MGTNAQCLTPKILDLGKWDSRAIRHYSTLPRIQKQLRRGNWTYIQEHPEAGRIIKLHQLFPLQQRFNFGVGAIVVGTGVVVGT
ncbi:uncharacterized protein [Drosophila virilis]|uniref:uncharacterized protein isoform X2 n=1 Tax=Drosophila virilis TaxID=7244 RepID=UPI0038B3BA6E